MTGNPITKCQCFVLCLNIYMPQMAPALPPIMLTKNNVFSGILHRCRLALYLSSHIIKNPARFKIIRYAIIYFSILALLHIFFNFLKNYTDYYYKNYISAFSTFSIHRNYFFHNINVTFNI